MLRRVVWIDKKTRLVVHLEYYEKEGLTRVYDVLKLQEQQGFWSVQQAEMNNIADEHKTLVEFGPFIYDQGLGDSLFQVGVLQRGAP